VTLREPDSVTAAELQQFVRERLAGFKVPDRIHFGDLPKTGTGKIQKFVLRQRAEQSASRASSGSAG
jgi:fatty-acyl-CoA synthase